MSYISATLAPATLSEWFLIGTVVVGIITIYLTGKYTTKEALQKSQENAKEIANLNKIVNGDVFQKKTDCIQRTAMTDKRYNDLKEDLRDINEDQERSRVERSAQIDNLRRELVQKIDTSHTELNSGITEVRKLVHELLLRK